MAGLIPSFGYTPEEIFQIKENMDTQLIREAIAKKVVTENNYIVRDLMPNSDFGSTYYDYEEWESAISLTENAYTKAIDVSLDGDKLVGFYGALGPSTQGVSAVKLQVGESKVIDEWQTQATRLGTVTTNGFDQGFLGIIKENEPVIYDRKDNIVAYYYGTETAAADDTTVLLGRVVEPVGKTAMGGGAMARTRGGLLPWFMITPRMTRDKIAATDDELVRRAVEQGIVEHNDYVIRNLLPSTEFSTTYYDYEKWTSDTAVVEHAWTTMVNTSLDSDKLVGFYGYSGPDDETTGLRFGVGSAQTKDVWMLEQTRRGERTGTPADFQLGNTALARTPIIYNGEDTIKIEAYGHDGTSGKYFTGVLHGRVIEAKGRKIEGR